jgi:hypothetical protein
MGNARGPEKAPLEPLEPVVPMIRFDYGWSCEYKEEKIQIVFKICKASYLSSA